MPGRRSPSYFWTKAGRRPKLQEDGSTDSQEQRVVWPWRLEAQPYIQTLSGLTYLSSRGQVCSKPLEQSISRTYEQLVQRRCANLPKLFAAQLHGSRSRRNVGQPPA